MINAKCENAFVQISKIHGNAFSSSKWGIEHIYDLVKSLYDKKMLPAIVFLSTCDECDLLTTKLCQY